MRAGRRRAARRARRGHGHVRRQPQHQRLQRLHRRLRVLRLRPGQALARRLRARRAGVRRGACTRRSTTARASCASSRASTPTGRSRTTWAGCALAKATAREAGTDSTCTPTARWRSRTCATSRGLPPAEVFARLRDAGPRLDARAPPPRCCTTACASGSRRTSCRSRAGSRSSRPPTAPGCARPRR